jgi:hypothetical protein
MAIRLQLARGAAARWAEVNPVLAAGEFGWDTTAKLFKVGDGSTRWADLDYVLTGDAAVPPSELRADYVHPYSYCGSAPKDALEPQTVWTVTRIEVEASGQVTTTTATEIAWVDRLTATYS